MKTKTLGGLEIRNITSESGSALLLLGENPYQYRMAVLRPGSKLELSGQDTYCFHAYTRLSAPIRIRIGDQQMRENQTLWAKHSKTLSIECLEGDCLLLIGSRQLGHGRSNEFRLFNEDQVKKVIKPWGYELWLTGDPSPDFAFKRIFIKAGTKTSLQYHVKKRETNCLLEGEAKLHYNPDSVVPAERFRPSDVAIETLKPISVVDVFPNHVHRLEAVSDILLCEVSTPELDDVVRISDDSGRKDGRVESEHKV